MKPSRWNAAIRLINRVLAGVNYLLALSVSVVVIIIAVVLFRSLVDDPGGENVATTTTTEVAALMPTTEAPAAPTAPATTVRVPNCVVAEPDPDEGNRNVRVFFTCGETDAPTGATWVYRQVAEGEKLLRAMIKHLVAGPSAAERHDGFRSLFSPATADAVIDVSRHRGDVVIDLRSLGPQPSLTAGNDGPFFLAELNNTLFQLDVIETIEYRIEGSCEDFWAYLGEDECLVIERSQWVGSDGASLDL